LAALKIPYEETIIDLSVPRTPEFLAINPRGLVPALDYNGSIVTESAIVATFLADAYPPALWPASDSPDGPLVRARINFFVDAYFSKAQNAWGKVLVAKEPEAEEQALKTYVDAISKHVEPLLHDASPYFGGSSSITLAEVSFWRSPVLRTSELFH
jgi:glutathione S-transferase